MATFFTPRTPCLGGEVNFFTSGAYTRGSFSQDWGTLTIPDTDLPSQNPIYLEVLNTYNIPYDSINGLPPRGQLPGIDIKRMDAMEAIRLSMAEALNENQWWEIYEDNEGGVYFQKVFDSGGGPGSPGKIINLDVRLCIPSANKQNTVDMVVVRGYDPPPEIFAGDFRTVVPAGAGTVNPSSVNGTESVFTVDVSLLVNSCHSTQLKKEAVKSYKNPLVDESSEFGSQVVNPFYDISAYEDILNWAVDIDGIPGIEDPGLAAKYQYSFEDSTTWFFPATFPNFSKKTDQAALEEAVGCADGLQTGGEITYYAGDITYTGPLFNDKYGHSWPLVTRPAIILYTGYKVNDIVIFGSGPTASNYVFVNPVKEFLQLGEGSQWTFTVPEVNQFKLNLFYQPEVDPLLWDIVLDVAQGGEGDVQLRVSDGKELVITRANAFVGSESGVGFLPGPNSLGFYVTGFWVGLELDRPCVRLVTAEGSARDYLDPLNIKYAPIIKRDLPAPIAYKHNGLVVKLDADRQAEGTKDNDPTTCQNFEDTPMAIMQDLMQGNVIDVTLPFCADVDACARVASTIYDYQNYIEAKTFTLTCGPDDEPELGAAVTGYDTNLRIESINYSFSDGSAYTIEVSLGPVFASIGSWQNGAWTRQRSDVGDREAFIIWSAGDGLNYRVMVQGLGTFNAFNVSQDPNAIWRVGERVTVNVRNAPLED